MPSQHQIHLGWRYCPRIRRSLSRLLTGILPKNIAVSLQCEGIRGDTLWCAGVGGLAASAILNGRTREWTLEECNETACDGDRQVTRRVSAVTRCLCPSPS
jgi:hypothetical protein